MAVDSRILALMIVIFVVASAVRLVDIDKPYETWDEITSYTVGLQLWYNIARMDFNSSHWTVSPHPPAARYIFGLANGAYLIQSSDSSIFHLSQNESVALLYSMKSMIPGRLVSVIFASLTVLLAFIGALLLYHDRRLAVLSGLILALTPAFMGFTKLETPDSILIFFFTLSMVSAIAFIKRGGDRFFILSAVSAGLAISTKLNAASLLFIIPLTYILFKGKQSLPASRAGWLKAVAFILIPAIIFIVVWPRLWSDPVSNTLEVLHEFSFVSTTDEYFMGGLAHPAYYYPAYFLAATPVFILLLALIGAIARRGNETYALLIWILLVIMLMSSTAVKQTGIKNILVAYPAVSILAALGVKAISDRLGGKSFLIISGLALAYLAASAMAVHPYYIDYYNELTGGPKNVYDNRMFAMGFWGEGTSEAAYWVSGNAANGSTVQFFVLPRHDVPPTNVTELDRYYLDYLVENGVVASSGPWLMNETAPSADYLVENVMYRWYVDPGFHDEITDKYRLLHTVEVGGAPLAWVYVKQ